MMSEQFLGIPKIDKIVKELRDESLSSLLTGNIIFPVELNYF
jgi:hypothetical protein